jgi:hypothetical protein
LIFGHGYELSCQTAVGFFDGDSYDILPQDLRRLPANRRIPADEDHGDAIITRDGRVESQLGQLQTVDADGPDNASGYGVVEDRVRCPGFGVVPDQEASRE